MPERGHACLCLCEYVVLCHKLRILPSQLEQIKVRKRHTHVNSWVACVQLYFERTCLDFHLGCEPNVCASLTRRCASWTSWRRMSTVSVFPIIHLC